MGGAAGFPDRRAQQLLGRLCDAAIEHDDEQIFAMVRDVVGPDVPIVATLDLHANVSDRMVANCSPDWR